MFDALFSLLYHMIPYLILPSLYGLYKGMQGTLMWKKNQIMICIVSTGLTLLVSTVYSFLHFRFPSLMGALLGGILSYYCCGQIHKILRERR